MKRFYGTFLLLGLSVLLTSLFGIIPVQAAPIPIDSCEKLANIGVDDDKPMNGSYILTQDIDCEATNPKSPNNPSSMWYDPVDEMGFVPIYQFSGTFDGQGHTIKNLYMNDYLDGYIGLFSFILPQGVVKNLRLINIEYYAYAPYNFVYGMGGIAGLMFGQSIENVYVQGKIGYDGDISLTQTDVQLIGGICGDIQHGDISNATVDIVFGIGNPNKDYIGGIAGSVTNSSNLTQTSAKVVIQGGKVVGGLVGSYSGGNLSKSYSTGTINAVVPGSITPAGETFAGGLIGSGWSVNIDNSYSTASVGSARYAAGLINTSTHLPAVHTYVNNSYFAGSIMDTQTISRLATGAINGSIIPVINPNQVVINSSYWDKDVIKGNIPVDTFAKSTTEMKAKNTFNAWDFSQIWSIDEAKDYPQLKSQAPSAAVLNLTLSGAGTGTITSAPAGINCVKSSGSQTGTCLASFVLNSPVILTYTPSDGSKIGNWGVSGCSNSSNTCSVTPDKDINLSISIDSANKEFNFVACSLSNCGNYAQNVARYSVASGKISVSPDGKVQISLSGVKLSNNLVSKKFDVFYGIFGNTSFSGIKIGEVTTDAQGNYSGDIKIGSGAAFSIPAGSSVTKSFILNDPGVRSEFVTPVPVVVPVGNLPAPTNLTATTLIGKDGRGYLGVSLKWTSPVGATMPVTYQIYRNGVPVNAARFVSTTSVSFTDTTPVDTSICPGNLSYYVVAKDATGKISADSNTAYDVCPDLNAK